VSTGKESPLKTYFQNRNRLLFMKRNVPRLNFLLFFGLYVLLVCPKEVLKYSRSRQPGHIKALINGMADFANGKIRLSMN
jgi:hypothetical protein